MQFETLLRCRAPRSDCPEHGIKTVERLAATRIWSAAAERSAAVGVSASIQCVALVARAPPEHPKAMLRYACHRPPKRARDAWFDRGDGATRIARLFRHSSSVPLTAPGARS